MTWKKKLSIRLIEELRSKIVDLETWISQSKARLTDVTFDMEKADASCRFCNSPLTVQKTVPREIVTLLHNRFRARERVLVCPRGCKHPNGKAVTHRDQTLAALVPPGANYGYDVEVYVGMERFARHRQREEIRSALIEEHSIPISSSEISVLAHRFLTHIEALHKYRADRIREIIRQDGGYTMHIDATTENGKGTMLVILSGWRRWALGAWRIPSESTMAIVPLIMEICGLFGEPCAIVRDLGKAIARAVDQAAAKMTVRPKILACHYHFLCDVGKDILNDDHDNLRKLSREFSVRGNIRGVVASLRKKAGPEAVAYAKRYFKELSSNNGSPAIPKGAAGLSLVIALAQWVLDYSHDSRNRKFPFGRPYHDLYKRCLAAKRAIDVFLAQACFDSAVHTALEALRASFLPFIEDKDVRSTVRDLEARMDLFDKFRALFRLEAEMPDSFIGDGAAEQNIAVWPANSKQVAQHERFESDMQHKVDTFAASLARRYNAMSSKQDIKPAIKVIIDHLKRHGEFLWGHLVELRIGDETKYRLVDRTNNALEGFFHAVKHGERRRSGRKILTRDFESLPPSVAIARNLADPDYIAAVCGSLDSLPLWFSRIDRDCVEKSNNVQGVAPFEVDDEYFSMSDKLFVRKQNVHDWVLAASQGRKIDSPQAKDASKAVLAPFEEIESFLDMSS